MNATHEESEAAARPQQDAPREPQGAPGPPRTPRPEHAGPPHAAGPPAPGYGAVPGATLGASDPSRKNPALAGILSAMPGLGQIYVGYYPRGFTHALVVASIITVLSTNAVRGLEPLLGMFLAFFWLYNIIDAVRRASLYNQVLAGGDVPALPDDFRMPTMGGSIFGGVGLLAAGFVLLLHTRFGMRLDFIEEWWPVLPMAFGAWLLARALMDRATGG